ncbi:hypothetical protein [Mycobacterium sp. SMC-15]|uniref:hypothetical protein n=1 Tax=Mycobacterium sp. SMC-15 TaxID=3381627 RepID=UPI003875B8F5
MTTTETAAPLIRAEKAAAIAGIGIVAMLVGESAHVAPLMLIGGVATAIGAEMAMSAGWFVGLTPHRSAPAASAGLVGSRISLNGGAIFTVLDDSAVRVDGRRASIVATDEAGNVGILFVGFSADGAVAEARIGDGVWGAAQVVG